MAFIIEELQLQKFVKSSEDILTLLFNNPYILFIIPLLCGLLIWFIPINIKAKKFISFLGILGSSCPFLLSLIFYIFYNNANYTYVQYSYFTNWIPFLAQPSIFIGLSGISLFFIILSSFLTWVVILLINLNIIAVKLHYSLYINLSLLLLFLLNLTFYVTNLLTFYILYESLLIPMFIMIGIWGARSRKIHAAYQFFLYTLIGSLFMLLAILYIKFITGSIDMIYLSTISLGFNHQLILWPMFFISFAIKLPLFPFHIWLPEAHVEAPTGGSIILAGILLKLGGYGIIRFLLPLVPYATVYYTPLVYILSILGVIYCSLTTIRQIDLKKIIAYSSVAHMSLVSAGLISLTYKGILGSILIMISHGFIASALFFAIGLLYDRYHTRLLPYFSGLNQVMPLFSFYFLLFCIANTGMPGTSSFISELIVLVGISEDNFFVAIYLSLGIIFSAIYSFWLYNRVMCGPVTERLLKLTKFSDIGNKENIILFMFLSIIIILGLIPELFFKPLYHPIEVLLSESIINLSFIYI